MRAMLPCSRKRYPANIPKCTIGRPSVCATRSQRRAKNLPRIPCLALLNDADPYIACEAAYAAAYLGETAKGIERLNNPAKEADRKIGYSLLECLSLDKAMQPPSAFIWQT